MIIERNEEEYVAEINQIYTELIRPQLQEGYSLTAALKNIGKGTQGKSRWYQEIRKLASDDGYKPRGGYTYRSKKGLL